MWHSLVSPHSSMKNGWVLLVHKRDWLKKLAQRKMKPLQITTLNTGILIGCNHELGEILKYYCICIACLQKTGWKGKKSGNIGEGYKLICHNMPNSNSIDVIVNEDLQSKCVWSPEIYWPSHVCHYWHLHLTAPVISTNALQTGLNEDTKEEF